MKTRLTQEQRDAIVSDLRAGVPYQEMQLKYGLSHYVIHETGRRAGLPKRGPGIRQPVVLPEVGQVFGRLAVIAPRAPGTGGKVPCRCECGTEISVRASNLSRGQTRSCGCLKLDVNVPAMHAAYPPSLGGLSGNPLYGRWCFMMGRCFDPRAASYRDYGRRGITVHESLRTPGAYIAYIESLEVPAGLIGNQQAIPGALLSEEHRGALYQKRKFSIDRIDNDGNYEPGNLRWATWMQQVHNQRPRMRNRAARELLASWEKSV